MPSTSIQKRLVEAVSFSILITVPFFQGSSIGLDLDTIY
jgi:hypothetical protein